MSRRNRELIHPTECLCGGEGWLWGYELQNPSNETLAARDARYSCDREWPADDLPPGPEPEPKIARGDA